ncbi:uncharacterized protein [Apostichopus japonicus]|uniref:uncharacterized protein n=1 Tax=Stichopus japonicus TaxID=307972 RepID=UPI003AB35025
MGRCLCLFLLLLLAILPFQAIHAKKMKGCFKLGFRACGAPIGKRTESQDVGPPKDYLQLWNELKGRESDTSCVLDNTVSLFPKHIQIRIYEIFADMVMKLAEDEQM